MNKAERRETIEAYGLAAVGLVGGLAIEGWQWAKDIIKERQHSVPELGRIALYAVETPAQDSNVTYSDFGLAEKPPMAA